MLVIIIKVAASIVLGVLAGFAAVYIFNKMPAGWLCDYGEKSGPELTDPHIQRVKGYPWRWIYAAGFACLLVRLSFCDIQFAAAGVFACWAMLIIGLADLKYMVIPDQFVIMLALSAFGFIPFHSSVWQPLLGAIVGGGAMLAVAGIGSLIFHREVMGFGDVKLMGALGLFTGWLNIIIVSVLAFLFAAVISIGILIAKKGKFNDYIPFGPFIVASTFITIFTPSALLLTIVLKIFTLGMYQG